jgi:Flp pilus assembly protein CpaB
VKRQTLILVLIGVILFAAGGAIAFVTATGAKNQTAGTPSAAAASTPVVVAVKPIPAGTTGQSMVSEGLVALETVPERTYAASDLPALASLNDEVLSTSIARGTAVRSTDLLANDTAISLPKTMDGFTITLNSANGLAGYLEPGSRVDIYANITKLSVGDNSTTDPAQQGVLVPCTELTMSNVQVLDVSSVVAQLGTGASATGRAVPGSETVLVAVSPAQARVLAFMAANETLSVAQTQPSSTPVTVGACISTDQTTAAPGAAS